MLPRYCANKDGLLITLEMMNSKTEIHVYQQAIVRLHRALSSAAESDADNFQIDLVAKLDKKVAAILTELAAKPALKSQLQRELAALERSHSRLRKQCQHHSMLLKQAMTRHNNNREGLMAYQEAEL